MAARVIATVYLASYVALSLFGFFDGSVTARSTLLNVALLGTTSYVCWWWVFGMPRQVADYVRHSVRGGMVGGDVRPDDTDTARLRPPPPRPEADDS